MSFIAIPLFLEQDHVLTFSCNMITRVSLSIQENFTAFGSLLFIALAFLKNTVQVFVEYSSI